jgi:hypothetical protein
MVVKKQCHASDSASNMLQPNVLECLLLSFWTWAMGKRVDLKELVVAAVMSLVHENKKM